MIEGIKSRLRYIKNNNLFDAHYINDMRNLISEVEHKDEIIRKWNELHEIEVVKRLKAEDQLKELQESYRVVNADYKALTDIMDRARKLAFQASDEVEEKSIFKMVDGCLTRIDYTKEGEHK